MDIILSQLSSSEQNATSQTSQRLYYATIPHLYRSIELTDYCNNETNDEHDDTPMIRMSLLFIQNSFLASQVREVSHRCHLHLPDVWADLTSMTFSNQTFSIDPRTSRLLYRAISTLTRVHTLRIVFGHQTIVQTLLSGFLNRRSPSPSHWPLRRLWIESSCLMDLSLLKVLTTANSLETFRCRRLTLFNETYADALATNDFGLARSRSIDSNGGRAGVAAGTYATTFRLQSAKSEFLREARNHAMSLEDGIYKRLPTSIQAYCDDEDLPEDAIAELSISEPSTRTPDEMDINQSPNSYVLSLLQESARTLTSINFDWLIGGQSLIRGLTEDRPYFPHLKALQIRNAVEDYARLPSYDACCLLSKPMLDFVKRHPNIQCLSWPLECFTPVSDFNSRYQEIDHETLDHLGRTLKELRVDTSIDTSIELEIGPESESLGKSRFQRQRFINDIAPKMTALESFKLEGSVGYSQRNQLVGALYQCPLRKLVVIGTCWAVHDSWENLAPNDRWRLMHNEQDFREHVGWSNSADHSSGKRLVDGFYQPETSLQSPGSRPFSTMLLETVALTQASTITELKLCGFIGAPPLSHPAPESRSQLSLLGHFHNLTYLTTAVWVSTFYKGDNYASEIRATWYARHRGIPTALTCINPKVPEDLTEYAKFVMAEFEPSSLAIKVAQLVGPHLSRRAIESKAGVTVRALYLLQGEDSVDMYEMDVKIGRSREVLSFVGPRGEHDPVREKEKLLNRGWF